MCEYTCACTLFVHWIIYILEIDLSCTIQSRSKFESSQVSEVFGSKPGFQHVKKMDPIQNKESI